MSFVPTPETSKPSNVDNNLELTYESFVKEEIIDVDEDESFENDESVVKNTHKIVHQPQLIKTTPRTVVISPKQSKGPIAITKHLSKPVFIPINLSNVKTIKVSNLA